MFTMGLWNAIKGNYVKKRPVSREWKVLCLIFQNIDVKYSDLAGIVQQICFSLPSHEIDTAIWSFSHFPQLAEECSCGIVRISYDIINIDHPISSLTSLGNNHYWVSPLDVRDDIDEYAPPGEYDSLFVHWPQNDLQENMCIPSPGWGLAIGPGSVPGGATYCTIANAPDHCWDTPLVGEVWLHEWLHGICDFYQDKGFRMPKQNADGGGSHGYFQSPVTGWGRYYRDLMTGRVKEGGRLTGIPPEAWLSGTIRSTKAH